MGRVKRFRAPRGDRPTLRVTPPVPVTVGKAKGLDMGEGSSQSGEGVPIFTLPEPCPISLRTGVIIALPPLQSF